MEGDTESQETAETTETATTGTEQTTTETVVEETGKPGGDGPQAVRARKEYQARKAADERAANFERELIAARERSKVLEEQLKAPKETTKPFTPQQIQAAVDAGQISQVEATAYLVEQAVTKRLDEERARLTKEAPITSARQELTEYVREVPNLASATSEESQKAFTEFNRLLSRGFPDNDATKAEAVRNVIGDLATVKARRETHELTRAGIKTVVPGSAGGGGPVAPAKIDVAKAPVTMQAMWNKEGTDDKARERQYRIYLDLKAAKQR